MILALDVGNTNIVVGCLQSSKEICFAERLSTDTKKTTTEYAIHLKNLLEIEQVCLDDLDGVIISSVVPPLTNRIQEAAFKVTGKRALVVGSGVKNGLHIQMDNPAQVGSDLIVDAVAAIAEYQAPLMVVDMGTATTISVDRKSVV